MNIYGRRQDSSIGFGAPVRANMRTGGVTSTAVTSSLLETVSENWSSISNSFMVPLLFFMQLPVFVFATNSF